MSYENRDIPEGINVSKIHPIKEFAWLAGGLIILVILAVLVLSVLAEKFASYIPFALEQKVALPIASRFQDDHPLSTDQAYIKDYLQSLAAVLAENQGLPEGMEVSVHYVDDSTVNALATLGGHIVIFKGILQIMPHENALSMVMAHEIAHIKHRDPIVSLGRGLTVYLALLSLVGLSDHGALEQMFSQTGLLTMLSFSREQESAADREAMLTLQRHYGHVEGAAALFEHIEKEEKEDKTPSFFQSHPHPRHRIETIRRYSQSLGDSADKQLTRIPERIQQLIKT
ncbi:MAG: M48 family metallopeptidase [Gammaproteobacteria bacterium]|nr:M48 family metallopeptidase [Gammaproteobacteria bacterium]